MTIRMRPFLVAIAFSTAALAADQPEPTSALQNTALQKAALQKAALEKAVELKIPNARVPLAGVLTGGQPDEQQLLELVASGYSRFISLRPATEAGAGWEEAKANEFSIEFVRIPINGGEDITLDNARFLQLAMKDVTQPVYIYCASGNRVGALLAWKAYKLDGVSAEQALALGRAAGVTKLEPRLVEMLGLASAPDAPKSK